MQDQAPDFRVDIVGEVPNTPIDWSTVPQPGGGGGGGAGGPGGGGAPWGIVPWAWRGLQKLFGGDGNSTAKKSSTNDLLKKILKDPQTYKDIVGTLGGIATGSATERGKENQYLDSFNRSLVGRYGIEQGAALDALLQAGRDKMTGYGVNQVATTSALQNQSAENLARARLGLEAPTTRARQSVMGSMMQNLQPRTVTAPPGQAGHQYTSRGGLNASVLDPMTRQHGTELMKDALNAQLTKSDVPAATNFMGGVLAKPEPTDYSKALIKPPTFREYQDPGKLESISSAGGTLADILGILMNARKRTQTPPTTPPRTDGTV
jgi:hypothetical protein